MVAHQDRPPDLTLIAIGERPITTMGVAQPETVSTTTRDQPVKLSTLKPTQDQTSTKGTMDKLEDPSTEMVVRSDTLLIESDLTNLYPMMNSKPTQQMFQLCQKNGLVVTTRNNPYLSLRCVCKFGLSPDFVLIHST